VSHALIRLEPRRERLFLSGSEGERGGMGGTVREIPEGHDIGSQEYTKWKGAILTKRWIFNGMTAAALCAAVFFAGCGGGSSGGSASSEEPGSIKGSTPTASSDLKDIAGRVNAVLALGYNTTNPDVVMKQLSGLDNTKAPSSFFVVDTREPADFAKGHIPGAVNIPLQTLPQSLLDNTSGIPMDKEVFVASYWGNDGNMASLLINIYRIADPVNPGSYPKSTAIFGGMTAWSFDRTLVPSKTRFDDGAGVVNVQKATETTAHAGVDKGAFPAFSAFTPATDTVVKKIMVRAKNYLNSVPTQFDLQVYAKTLSDNLEDGNAGNDPQIISVRNAPDYAGGHIPGAINIPYKNVADLANYTKFVDPAKPAVVYCYTGHTGSLSTMALGILGYNVKDILYGMNGWSTTATGSGQLKDYDLNKAWDFPLHNWGTGIANLAAYTPPSTGCQGCHTSLTAIFTELVKFPATSAAAPPSSGEG
jgi:rhodanese-related sulfurtransferase